MADNQPAWITNISAWWLTMMLALVGLELGPEDRYEPLAKELGPESGQESLQAGVITDGRRKAAAAADERFKEQVAMERGLLRVKKAMNRKWHLNEIESDMCCDFGWKLTLALH